MKSALTRTLVLALVMDALSNGCNQSQGRRSGDSVGGEVAASNPSSSAAVDTSSQPGCMAGIGGAGMMDSMRLQLRGMTSMTGQQMTAVLPAHRQMVGYLMTQMTSYMRAIGVQPSRSWTATADSVQSDLDRFPQIGPAELGRAMPAHQARVRRLMRMAPGCMHTPAQNSGQKSSCCR